jgi:hypothetical protein
MTTTINPFDHLKKEQTQETALTYTPPAASVGPNKLDSTKHCPVDNEVMKRMTAGLKGSGKEIPVYVCIKHRVCLPVPNEELGPEQSHV